MGTVLVNAEPVQRHIRMLQDYGIGIPQIAYLAASSVEAVRRIVREGVRKVGAEKAQRVLVIQPTLENAGEYSLIRAEPYVRMVRSLVALGWDKRKLTKMIAPAATSLDFLYAYKEDPEARVRAFTARRVVEVYNRLSMERPVGKVANRTRIIARKHGWPLPLDWEATSGGFFAQEEAKRSAA